MDYYDIVVALRMALVAAGAFDRQVSIGSIAADNASLNANLMTTYLAERRGLAVPELGEDFRAFMRNSTPVTRARRCRTAGHARPCGPYPAAPASAPRWCRALPERGNDCAEQRVEVAVARGQFGLAGHRAGTGR